MRKKSVGGTNEHPKIVRQTVYQRGSQREGSPHYVLLYSDDEGSEDEENIPLQSRHHHASPPRKVEVINIQLKPDDTLQALALRYRCTISELKRINNIHRENEIYAHRSIKVPVQPYSILTETLDQNVNVHQNVDFEKIQTEPTTSREEQIINLIATPVSSLPQKMGINDTILNSLCEPLPLPGNKDSLEDVGETECDQLLGPLENSESESHVTDTFKCSGADWGLSWAQLVGCSLLLGFAGPIIYILYLAEYSSKHQATAGH